MMMSYEEIAEAYGIKLRQVLHKVLLLQLPTTGRRAGGRNRIMFSQEYVRQIAACKPYEIDYENHPRKIAIIEFYAKWGNAKKVKNFFHIDEKYVYAAIREHQQTGHITIASKMNHPPEYWLEEQHGEFYLYDDEDNPVASTENIQNWYLLSRANIEAHLTFRRARRGRQKVEICTTDESEEIPWIKNRTITIKNMSPS